MKCWMKILWTMKPLTIYKSIRKWELHFINRFNNTFHYFSCLSETTLSKTFMFWIKWNAEWKFCEQWNPSPYIKVSANGNYILSTVSIILFIIFHVYLKQLLFKTIMLCIKLNSEWNIFSRLNPLSNIREVANGITFYQPFH